MVVCGLRLVISYHVARVLLESYQDLLHLFKWMQDSFKWICRICKLILPLLQVSRFFQMLQYSLFAGQESYHRRVRAMTMAELRCYMKIAFKRLALHKSSHYSILLLGLWLIFIWMRSVRATCADHDHIIGLHQSQCYDLGPVGSCSQHRSSAGEQTESLVAPVRPVRP